MSVFKFNDIKEYLDKPLQSLFYKEDSEELRMVTKDGKEIPEVELYIEAEEERIRSMGFPCIDNKNPLFRPIVASFLQHSFVQRSNQQLSIPYSQIEASYKDALQWLIENPNICNKGATLPFRSPFSIRRNRLTNAGW